jgi:hypothetical protein
MTIPRLQRIRYNDLAVTPDTAAALRHLEKRADQIKDMRLSISGPTEVDMTWDKMRMRPGPTNLPPEWSALPTGREVYLGVEIIDDELSKESRLERSLAMLWALAVPLGFTPYTRYPLPGPHMSVFHFMGPWDILMDHMLGAGRGEAAWPGFCGAAQADVGAWEGGKQTERFVQSHLHRLGYNCGAIDGIVGNSVLAALKAAGMSGKPLMDVAEALGKEGTRDTRKPRQPIEGSVELPDTDFSIVSYGQVRTTRTPKGALISVAGAGRIVVDVRET